MFSQEEVLKQVLDCLDEVGINLENYEGDILDLDIKVFVEESIDFINLVVALEERLKIELPDEFLAFDSITTISSITNFIYALLLEEGR